MREIFLDYIKGRFPQNCIAAEIGVLNGDFSQMILDALHPAKLILIDPYAQSDKRYEDGLHTAYSTEQDYQNLKKRFTNDPRVEIIRKFSYDAAKGFPDKTFDFIYIDASHLYEDVKRDLNDWLPKLKSFGILAGHDYIKHKDFGVIKAVDEFRTQNNFGAFVHNENTGDWAIL